MDDERDVWKKLPPFHHLNTYINTVWKMPQIGPNWSFKSPSYTKNLAIQTWQVGPNSWNEEAGSWSYFVDLFDVIFDFLSPLNHHWGEYCFLFPSILSKSKYFVGFPRSYLASFRRLVWRNSSGKTTAGTKSQSLLPPSFAGDCYWCRPSHSISEPNLIQDSILCRRLLLMPTKSFN